MTQQSDGADANASAPSRPGPSRRAAYDIEQRHRSTLVASVSTVLVVAAIILLVPLTPGWDRVRASFFDWDTFTESLPKLWKPFIVLASYVFYGWANPIWAVIMFFGSSVDYFCGLALVKLSGLPTLRLRGSIPNAAEQHPRSAL